MITKELAADFGRRFLKTEGEQRAKLLDEVALAAGIDASEVHDYLMDCEDEGFFIERIQLFEVETSRSRAELVGLVERMIRGEGSAAEMDEWLRLIEANVPAPDGYVTDLIYYPEGDDPTAEEVVDRALNYQAQVTPLGPSSADS